MTDDHPDLEPLDVPSPWAVDPARAEETPEPKAPRPVNAAVVALVIVALVAGFAGFAVTSRLQSATSFEAALSPGSSSPTTPGAGRAPSSTDPDASVLHGLGVQQQDVAPANTVELLARGDRVAGEVTLDLCNGTFASEVLRTARFQVLEASASNTVVLSTEAVLYRNPGATDQAFAELRQVRAACPHTPVPSKSATGDTVTTTFRRAPDTSWPITPSVERLAYDFDTVSLQGDREHSIGVYLKRGRVLLGVYFPKPDGAQPPVAGKTTVPGIVQVFEKRLAALPAAVVNRHA